MTPQHPTGYLERPTARPGNLAISRRQPRVPTIAIACRAVVTATGSCHRYDWIAPTFAVRFTNVAINLLSITRPVYMREQSRIETRASERERIGVGRDQPDRFHPPSLPPSFSQQVHIGINRGSVDISRKFKCPLRKSKVEAFDPLLGKYRTTYRMIHLHASVTQELIFLLDDRCILYRRKITFRIFARHAFFIFYFHRRAATPTFCLRIA